jgi:hypothetical protein
MEKSPVLIALLTMMMVKSVNAQIDSTHQDNTQKNQSRTLYERDKFRKEDRILVNAEGVPSALKKTLDANKKYEGWQRSTIWFDKTVKQYLLHLTDSATGTRTYKFDENGKALDERDPDNK